MRIASFLIALIAGVAVVGARAEAPVALDCLRAAASNGGLEDCLNERVGRAPVVAPASWKSASNLAVAGLESAVAKPPRYVPTPLGYAATEDGTLKAGFFKGLDSGFKTVFMGFVYPAVAGIEASGAPQRSNVGTGVFTVLGVLLSIPGSIVGALVGAPLGALAGMIAEKAAPGSTARWFTF